MFCLAFIYPRHFVEMQVLSGFGNKDCLTETSLERKWFGKNNEIGEFYTFNDKYVRHSIRKSIISGRVATLNRYFDSQHCEDILNAIEGF